MLSVRTRSVEETRAVAGALAELARPHDLVLLAGDLGAGKTAFVQGFGRGLGVEVPITSPTFTLANEYEGGRLRVHHLDVYRFEAMAELFDVDLPELLDDEAVTLVEWGDAIAPGVPADFLEIRLLLGGDDDERVLELRCVGASWSARTRALGTVLEQWKLEA